IPAPFDVEERMQNAECRRKNPERAHGTITVRESRHRPFLDSTFCILHSAFLLNDVPSGAPGGAQSS
ncbi:MAG TPA: hypothetical protein VMS56_00370, partial [Thermoanaerobaculia bacterium]|nr:hypothetical protein [Thermoanaerobaculia bacterium]